MSRIVLDTDVISYFIKRDPRVSPYESLVSGHKIVVSFMTEAELERWALQSNWGPAKRARLAEYLEPMIRVPSSRDLIERWAFIMVAARSVGRRIEVADAWIAATALLYDIPLVTHNRSDFAGVPNLKILP
jgi:tRNA(fMet)-specific endonuclease VapC